MDLDDNGKERRNALIVSALLFSAAYLELKLPSFVAEYIKLEIAPTAQFKIWALAAVLAGYVAMRYHFSPGRAFAADLERAAFATSYLHSGGGNSAINDCKAVAYRAILELPGMQKAQRDGFHLAANQVVPFAITPDRNGKCMHVFWRLDDSLRSGGLSSLGGYDPMTTSRLAIYRPKRFALKWLARQAIWSRKAWEVNPVYLVCCTAIYLCMTRAAQLAGGWASLARSLISV